MFIESSLLNDGCPPEPGEDPRDTGEGERESGREDGLEPPGDSGLEPKSGMWQEMGCMKGFEHAGPRGLGISGPITADYRRLHKGHHAL